jgi:iron(III) transport system substrate-binding protein
MKHEALERSTFLRAAAAAGALAGIPRIASARDADVGKLYADAKREGTVTWWTAHYAEDAAQKVREAFKRKYPGIEVEVLRQTAQVIYQRAVQDFKAGVPSVDVHMRRRIWARCRRRCARSPTTRRTMPARCAS